MHPIASLFEPLIIEAERITIAFNNHEYHHFFDPWRLEFTFYYFFFHQKLFKILNLEIKIYLKI
jgi:hypothetical protein